MILMFTSTNVGLYFRVSEAKILQHRGRMRAKVKVIFDIKKLFFSKFASFVYITCAEKYVYSKYGIQIVQAVIEI